MEERRTGLTEYYYFWYDDNQEKQFYLTSFVLRVKNICVRTKVQVF